jgi:hypothetical protein
VHTRQLQRRVNLVAVVPKGPALLQGGPGHKAVRLVDKQHGLMAGKLALHHQIAIPQVMGAAEGIGLADAPAQGVVAIVGPWRLTRAWVSWWAASQLNWVSLYCLRLWLSWVQQVNLLCWSH